MNAGEGDNNQKVPESGSTQRIDLLKRSHLTLREFKFLCVFCGKKLAAPEHAVGRIIECPECRNVIEVPSPVPVTSVLARTDIGVSYMKSLMFRFHCVRCGQVLEVDRSTAGTKVICAVCHSEVQVPKPADD